MSESRSFTIWREGERWSLLWLEVGKHRPFHLDSLSTFTTEQGPPTTMRQGAGREGTRLVQLLPDDDVQQISTSLPDLKPREMRKAVLGTLLREKGGSEADWTFAYRILPRIPGRQSQMREITILHAANETVNEHRDPVIEWDLRPGIMLPGCLAMDQLFRRHGGDLAGGEAWNLVCITHDTRFLCVGDGDGMLMNRALPEDTATDRNSEAYLDRLVTEIERSNFFAQQTERSLRVERIVVCGDPEFAAALASRLDASVNQEVAVWPVEELFTVPEDKRVADFLIPLAAAAVGLEGVELNLLPPLSRVWLGKLARRRVLVAAGTCGVVLAPLLLVGGLVTTRIQDNQLELLREMLVETQELADRAEVAYQAHRVLLARENKVEAIAATEPALADVLRQMAVATPERVVYRNLQVKPDAGGRFVLSLTAESYADSRTEAQQAFLDFTAKLERNKRLVPLSEPTELHLTGDLNPMTDRARLVFSLEYLIRPEAEN